MHGLKLNISCTLFALLATGMLLINIIMTTLWQRSLISEKIEQQQRILSAAVNDIGTTPTKLEKFLKSIVSETPDSCGGILVEEDWIIISAAPCEPSQELRQLASLATQTQKPTTSSTGKTLGIFFTQKKYLDIAVPFTDSTNHRGAIATAIPLQPTWHALLENQKIILVYILVNTLLLTVIGFFRLASTILRPIDRLVLATHSYSTEQNLGFVSEQEESEFRSLSSAINNMVQRIDKDKINLKNSISSLEQANKTIQQNQLEMVRTEKLASVGRLSAGLAHEIGNPLGIVLGYLSLLQKDDLSKKERLEYIQRSEDELNRINTLVRQLLDFSRPVALDDEAVDIHALLVEIVDMLESQKKNRHIAFIHNLPEDNPAVHGNKEALRQVFVNFLLNSIDAIQETNHPDEGTITINSKTFQNDVNQDMLQITLIDNGCGIPSASMENIFDPFYTTKDPGKGTGLGLSVSYGIIEKTGGKVYAQNLEDQGTSIIIELPLTASPNA